MPVNARAIIIIFLRKTCVHRSGPQTLFFDAHRAHSIRLLAWFACCSNVRGRTFCLQTDAINSVWLFDNVFLMHTAHSLSLVCLRVPVCLRSERMHPNTNKYTQNIYLFSQMVREPIGRKLEMQPASGLANKHKHTNAIIMHISVRVRKILSSRGRSVNVWVCLNIYSQSIYVIIKKPNRIATRCETKTNRESAHT